MSNLLRIFSILLVFFNAGSAKAENDVSASVITFKNFNKNIHLHKEGEYYRTEDGLLVKLNDQILVKTHKNFVLHDLVSSHNEIVDGSEIFVAREFNYYLVKIAEASNIGVMIDTLLSFPEILLVQPDLLQIAYNAQDKNKKTSGIGADLTDEKFSAIGEPVFAHSSEFHLRNKPNLEKKAKRTKRIYEAYLAKLDVPQLLKSSQGQGVRIAIIDDGIELQHPALQHVAKDFIYDLESQTNTITAVAVGAEHGTKVAGIIFANHDDNDSHRIQGLAPKATLIALRNPTTLTSNTLLSFQLSMLANADIVNCSWNSYLLLQPIADAVNELAEYGRGGKGTAVIFSAGNEGRLLREKSIEASLKKAIVVAASNVHGARLIKSNYGESIDLLVFGMRVQSTATFDEYQYFAGTSLAAAITTGIAALTLSIQKDLSLEQLQAQLSNLTTF